MKKIFVIKIGGSVLFTKDKSFNEDFIKHLAEQIVALREKGIAIVLVVSGAVVYGSHVVDLSERLGYKRQAAAGIGQFHIMNAFDNIFKQFDLQVAQVLITKYGFLSSQKEIKQILEFYINNKIIPMINENDVVELNSFGGNDLLAGEIAKLLRVEKLVMFSTMERAAHATGGGATKHQAIALLRENNIDAVIVEGKKKNVLVDLV